MIRAATQADIPAILMLWNLAIRETLITFNTVEKSPDDVANAIRVYDAFLVAEYDGQVVGFAALFPFRTGVGYAHTKEHSIIVSPSARGCGLGRALILTLETAARDQGVHSMIAGVSASNPDGEPFHAAIGFDTVGRVADAGYKFGQWHDLVLMQKKL
ncbi:GNAT family N-acetyltransferase [Aliiroseovarius sp. F47248L]|uniref:GNAT family N-acetyltransferase n=1 Tax=Aliiroseovarius sp. F47248L TaxID=2926420 RepID=UPI001FF6C61B|nr:GNAT family N-acetyltransferase [Aliiroseovarius sp. F47248L]MCK0137796.1 N-acetyltransferase family protein [Aliiroseovarius sp. F47248L]